jgi:hypothetical protein
MTDQRIVLQPELMRNDFNIVGHRCDIVPPIWRNGVAPAALVEHDPCHVRDEPPQ